MSAELEAALAEQAVRYGLPPGAPTMLGRLLSALSAEHDPPTTVREPLAAARTHVADSLVALDLPRVRDARRVVDLGAGAGFPGLALAIALPDAHVDLVESARRKAAVIERLARAAGLEVAGADCAGGSVREVRVLAVPERAEIWAAGAAGGSYDLVTARALASLPVLAEYAAPLLARGGALVA